MTRLMVLLTFLATILTVTITVTEKPIAVNRAEATKEALYEIFPAMNTYADFTIENGAVKKAEGKIPKDAKKITATYDANNALLGFAIDKGPRVCGGCRNLVFVLTRQRMHYRIQVVSSKETSGFGDKIALPAFREQFRCLEAKVNPEKTALLHEIKRTAAGKKTNAWEFDGISGATVTSKALEKMLIESTNSALPIIAKIWKFL